MAIRNEDLRLPNLELQGLADTSDYDALDAEVARWAMEVAENLISEVFRLAGVSTDMIPHALHAWLGKPPS